MRTLQCLNEGSYTTSISAKIPGPWLVWYECPFNAEHSKILFYAYWPGVHFCVNHCVWWGLRDALIYKYSKKSLGVILMLYTFRKIKVVGCLLGLISYLDTGCWLCWQYQVWIPSHRAHLKSNFKDCVPLLAYLARWGNTVACRVHSWVRLRIIFLIWQYAWYFLPLWELANRDFFLFHDSSIFSHSFKFWRRLISIGNSQ
jgi:hypothetical protein